jgi:hypothetical protein
MFMVNLSSSLAISQKSNSHSISIAFERFTLAFDCPRAATITVNSCDALVTRCCHPRSHY